MDFIISKVAMSACALLVVGVLGGCMDPSRFADPGHELDAVVREFCSLVDRATLSRSLSSLTWEVPYLSDGQVLRVVIDRGTVVAEGGEGRSAGQPVTGIHTWRSTGASMNTTGLMLLDTLAEKFAALSGEAVLLVTELVLIDNEPTYLAFVRGVR